METYRPLSCAPMINGNGRTPKLIARNENALADVRRTGRTVIRHGSPATRSTSASPRTRDATRRRLEQSPYRDHGRRPTSLVGGSVRTRRTFNPVNGDATMKCAWRRLPAIFRDGLITWQNPCAGSSVSARKRKTTTRTTAKRRVQLTRCPSLVDQCAVGNIKTSLSTDGLYVCWRSRR